MKKTNLFFLFCLLPFSLLSCNGKSEAENEAENKILLKKAEGVTTMFHLLSADQLRSVTRYEDAVIFVSLPNCSHCKKERTFLDEYIKNTQCILYDISFDIYQEAYDDQTNSIGEYAFQFPKVTGTPTYLFYKNGKLTASHIAGFGNDSYNDFVDTFEKYVRPINLYMTNDYFSGKENDGLIEYQYFDNSENLEQTKNLDILGFSTETMKQKIQEEKNITILFTWRRCQDCSSLRNDFLNVYLLEHQDKKIYYYEIDGYAQLKRMSDATYRTLGLNMWSDFSNEFKLIDDDFFHIDDLGNHAGYTPTIVHYENGKYVSKEVYLNEEEVIMNDDYTLSYSKAFHSEAKALKSDTKVKNNDTTDSNYQKALKELNNKVKEYDLDTISAYIKEVL